MELVIFGLVLFGEDFHLFANQSVVEEVVICKEGVCKNNYYLQLTMFDKNKVKTPSENRKTQFSY